MIRNLYIFFLVHKRKHLEYQITPDNQLCINLFELLYLLYCFLYLSTMTQCRLLSIEQTLPRYPSLFFEGTPPQQTRLVTLSSFRSSDFVIPYVVETTFELQFSTDLKESKLLCPFLHSTPTSLTSELLERYVLVKIRCSFLFEDLPNFVQVQPVYWVLR